MNKFEADFVLYRPKKNDEIPVTGEQIDLENYDSLLYGKVARNNLGKMFKDIEEAFIATGSRLVVGDVIKISGAYFSLIQMWGDRGKMLNVITAAERGETVS